MPPVDDPAAPRRATLAAVADAAGVSIATASRALNGRGDLASATRRRVHAVAREVGYVREPSVGGRPLGSARLLDLVLGSYDDDYSAEVTAGARTAAADAGYDLVLTEERDTPDDDWPLRIRRRGSAGVVLGLISPTAPQLSALADASIPVVLMDPRSDAPRGLTRVHTTDHDGGRSAAAHLVERGATRFAVLLGLPRYRYGRTRHAGFREGLREALPGSAATVVQAEWRSSSARDAVIPLLRDLAPGERLGVFACSDELAAGVYAAASATGRRIPDDVLVVGFDDLRGARWLTPALTTVRQPIREMAAAAVDALADAAAGGELSGGPIVLPTRLVVRAST
ncbi:LacI family DNA-binding transcriptional regulator [Microbacterium sp. C5A9]|uniref:LacI family DNA-binding transcriptional regulator n=1 Tax=Microbacterium sp. C5A9 TaxID=2736663 RepID=UPI001F51A0E2|nr:LacI family DNA-binding transcriptional regulator [Microbacterium sp. C5A9]MCI1017064.1 LacI family DNA-binding transcriptional regulator [Microbacterium sp. C5A9]